MEVKLVWRFKVNLPKFEHIDMYRLGVLHIKLANDHGDFSKKWSTVIYVESLKEVRWQALPSRHKPVSL